MAANFLGAIMKHTQSTALPAVFGPLAFLSMQHVEPGECPQAPTNEERMRAFRNARAALRSQIPMVTVMVGFTVFALWLLKEASEL